ncbi:MAG: CinA family protein [Cocleimonas sp.]
MTDILHKVSQKLHENNLSLVSAESCTGGWVAKILTDLEGSSSVFDRGFVTYSNQSKQDMLGVSSHALDSFGAVSEQVAIEMAEGALENSQADIALSITGIAGPGGGSVEKPVGMVCFGWKQTSHKVVSSTIYFDGDRDSVRAQAVDFALKGVIELIGEVKNS